MTFKLIRMETSERIVKSFPIKSGNGTNDKNAYVIAVVDLDDRIWPGDVVTVDCNVGLSTPGGQPQLQSVGLYMRDNYKVGRGYSMERLAEDDFYRVLRFYGDNTLKEQHHDDHGVSRGFIVRNGFRRLLVMARGAKKGNVGDSHIDVDKVDVGITALIDTHGLLYSPKCRHP